MRVSQFLIYPLLMMRIYANRRDDVMNSFPKLNTKQFWTTNNTRQFWTTNNTRDLILCSEDHTVISNIHSTVFISTIWMLFHI